MNKAEYAAGIIFIILFGTHLFVVDIAVLFSVWLVLHALFWFFAGLPLITDEGYAYSFERVNKDAKQILPVGFAAATGIAISLIMIGAVFKLLHWPGGDFDLYIGLTAAAILFTASAVLYFVKKNKLYLKIIVRILIFGAFGIWALVS